MAKNVGGSERTVRIIVGLALVGVEISGASPISPWGWIGVVPLITGLIGWCPPYAIFGINTCKTKTS